MAGGAVLRAAEGGVIRRRVQAAVVFLVLTAGTAAAVLGLSLATSANAQFLGAFARQHGAHLAVTVDSAKVTNAQLAATSHVRGVTQAAGPYPETAIYLDAGHPEGIPALPSNPSVVDPSTGVAVVGRGSMGGALDDITLKMGRWATRPGEIDIDPSVSGAPLGSMVTVTSAPGKPELKVVGYASSVTRDQEAWVAPSQLAALRAHAAPAKEQMLYTFASAATAQQISAGLAALKRALPAGAITNSVSWLVTEGPLAQVTGINTPFVVAFAVIALVLAVLITASVASAAVVASYQRIGVLKSIGFTPVQVTATYLTQLGAPALAGATAGTILGDMWVLPDLNGGPFATQPVPLWINVTALLGMCALTGLAVLVPAARAGRLSAVAAIAAGQAPRAGRGYAAHRVTGKLALPRPVSIGLAAPFSRPARSAATLAAVTYGLTAVVLAVGLNSSLAKINEGATQWQQAVVVGAGTPPGKRALTTNQQRTVVAALRAQPGTLRYVAEESGEASVPGVGSHVPVTAYDGDAAALEWDITSGTWYNGPGQVVVNIAQPGTAGLTAGQIIRMTVGRTAVTARITGEVYAPGAGLGALFTSEQTFRRAGSGLPVTLYEAVPRPGTDKQRYQAALSHALGPSFEVSGIGTGINGVGLFGLVDTSLIRLLTVLVAILAGLGVLNSVLMLTRERVHDLGVFKAVGMTPRQTIAMVTCWVIAPAIIAAVIALPSGMALQNVVMRAIDNDQPAIVRSATPIGSLVHVYTAGGLALLALAGLTIAITGALGPATWAAASRTTTALRAE
jgi:putative ABC transport system permease protein